MKTAAKNRTRGFVESLESRWMFHVVPTPIADVAVPLGAAAGTVDLSTKFENEELTGTIVQVTTSLGTFDIELTDAATPVTVANFLSYVNSGAYNTSFIHRSAKTGDGAPFVIQGGGYQVTQGLPHITTAAPIANEASPARPNARGTIAMARTDTLNSATSEWFVNLSDNTTLDAAASPYAVFGHVIGNGMTVVDAIAALPRVSIGGAFTELPAQSYKRGQSVGFGNLVTTPSVAVIPEISGYTVTSSNPAIVSGLVNGKNLALNYGAPGTANVTVTATDVLGNVASSTFAVTVQPSPTPKLVVREASGAAVASAQATPVGFGASAVGAAGATRVLTLQNYGAQPLVLGAIDVPAGYTVVGTAPTTIAPLGTATLTLVVDTAAVGTRAGNVTIPSNDPSGAFVVPVAGVVGTGVKIGTGGLKSATFTDADGTVSTVSLSGGGSATLVFTGTGVSVTDEKRGTVGGTGVGLANVTVDASTARTRVVVTSRGGDRISNVGGLTSAAAFDGIQGTGVRLTGTVSAPAMRTLNVSSLENAEVTIGAGSGPLAFSAKTVTDSALTSQSAVNTVRVTTWTDNGSDDPVSVAALNSFSATMVTGLQLTSAAAAGTVIVKGAMNNSTVRATSARSFSAASVSGTNVYAGYAGTALPTNKSQFAAGSAITTFTVRGAFANSNVAAAQIRTANVGVVTTNSGTGSFGVAGDVITTLTGRTSGGKTIRLTRLDNPTSAAAAIAALGDTGNFKVVVL